MPWTLTKEFRFEAAHALTHLPEGHKCRRPHGHSYRVELVLESAELDRRGFAGGIDYADLDAFGEHLQARYDHEDLNRVVGATGSTAENLARHFYDWAKQRWPQLVAVRVYETPKTMVEYRP